jgi:hypothetical protein
MSSADRETVALAPARRYSRPAWRTLILIALIIALLPIPVALLQLLPIYRVHALFLAFYAPLVCIFILAYLVYVRDALARFVLADFLNPSPHHWYSRTGLRRTVRRRLRTLRQALLSLLPPLLLLTSLYCVVEYTARLDDSVDLVTRTLAKHVGADEEVGFVPGAKPTEPDVSLPGEEMSEKRSPAPSATAPSGSSHQRPTRTREFVLRNAGVADIPFFFQLTALYVGAFASALLAMALMALKEYARDALQLSEADLVLRRTHDFRDGQDL